MTHNQSYHIWFVELADLPFYMRHRGLQSVNDSFLKSRNLLLDEVISKILSCLKKIY